MSSERRTRSQLLLLTALGLAGCALDALSLPVRSSVVVIHGVLSPSALTQTVLIERTLTGEVPVTRFLPLDGVLPLNSINFLEPILSDGGNPVRGALVELERPDGSIMVAPELSTISSTGNGAGVYRFALAGTALVGGGTYRLRVRTQQGEELRAEVTIPQAPGVGAAPAAVPLNRDVEAVSLSWDPIAATRAYEVRIESPYGAWVAITDSTHVALDGDLRNGSTEQLARVLIPGFRQSVTISAVDANLYEYYRTVNDGATGSGINNRVIGGLGVFGAHAPLLRRRYDVIATVDQPIEGTYDLIENEHGFFYGGAVGATALSLYVESSGANGTQPATIGASFERPIGIDPGAASGSFLDGLLRLQFHANQTMSDTLETMTAELRGDTLVGNFSKGAPVRYVRRTP